MGHATNLEAGTGCTVIVAPRGAAAGVDVRGGAPASRETDLLRPENTVEAMRHNIAVLCEILAAAGGTHADGSREGKLIEEFL